MVFNCQNAQEESLKEIARQMTITNNLELLRELYRMKAITKEKYIDELRGLLRVA